MLHTQKTEKEEKLEKAKYKLAIMFDTLSYGSVMYWHSLTITQNEE